MTNERREKLKRIREAILTDLEMEVLTPHVRHLMVARIREINEELENVGN